MKATVLALSLLCAGTVLAQTPTPAAASARQRSTWTISPRCWI